MKKVSVTLKQNVQGKRKFYLFPTVESLYEWSTTPEGKTPDPVHGLDIVELEPGSFFEAEWIGCEYSYEGTVTKKFDCIRLAMEHESKNSSGTLMTMHYGWIEDAWIPFYDVETDDLVIKKITKEECQFNMPEAFPEDEDEEILEDDE